jgi:hypothetical protein
VSLFSLSSSRDNRFRLTEGLYLKIKITTAEKRTKLLIIDRQHFDISWIMNMVYMNIIICWNIMMAMCIYYGPAIDVSVACRRLIISKPWPVR